MDILVIGSGGREHVICKKISESPLVENVYCAKGNAGMTIDGIQLVDIKEDNHDGLIEFAKEKQIAWTFVGPEVPLLNGIVDDWPGSDLTEEEINKIIDAFNSVSEQYIVTKEELKEAMIEGE